MSDATLNNGGPERQPADREPQEVRTDQVDQSRDATRRILLPALGLTELRQEIALTKPLFSSHPFRPALAHGPEPSLLRSESGILRREKGEQPRVMLIVPPYTRFRGPAPEGSALHDIGVSDFEVMKRAGTPIGLLRIGTVAKQRGYDIRIVDAPFEGWDQEETFLHLPNGKLLRYGLKDELIRRAIEEFEPDVVGIQCNYTVQWGNARALADMVKSIDRNLVVVGGGAHCSGDWENALRDSPMDAIVANEADVTFVELLDALTKSDLSATDVLGIRYRTRDRVVSSGNRSYMGKGDIKKMQLPDFSLLNMGLYQQLFHSAGARVRKDGAWAQIFSTIGCNVGCDFCYIPMINGPWRSLGIDWFDKHLADIKEHGVTEVLIEDDHLLHDPMYAMEIFKLLEKHNLPWVEEGGLSLFNLIVLHLGAHFLTSLDEKERNHPNFRHAIRAVQSGLTARDLIAAMARSGCYSVYLAVESANEESLKHSNKPRINAIQRATQEIVSMFAEVGIQVTGGFMLGFVNPPDTPDGSPYVESLDQIERTINYAVQLMGAGMAYANPFIVTPIPGTRMWEYQKGFVVRDYDTGWSHERSTMATSCWSAEDIERMRLKLLVKANGPEKVRSMLQRGTWPVDA
jgi:anaerobic magnesium-protoporphyrin IX monomethyl ester cyclase